jgi:apolipoprotein N-acyltransferase
VTERGSRRRRRDGAEAAAGPWGAAVASRRDRRGLGVAAAVIATGALLAVASPAVGLSLAIWVVLVPGTLVVCRARSWRAALAIGVLLGGAASAALSWWLVGALEAYHEIGPVLGWPLFAGYALVGQLQLPLWAMIRWWLRDRHDPVAVIALAAAYAGLDWLVPKLFLDTLAVACHADARLIQLVDLGGPFLLTFVIVLVSQAIVAAIAWRRAAWPAGAVAAAALAIALSYGQVRRAAIEDAVAAAPRIRVAVAQANVGNLEKIATFTGDEATVMDVLRRYGELSDREVMGPHKPDLVVWPETAYPLAWGAHRSTLDDEIEQEIVTYARERDVAMVFGGYHRVGDTEFNSAIALAPDGSSSVYHKVVLVPFAETYPFPASLLRRPLFGSGGTPRTLDVKLAGAPGRPAIRIAPIICYEALVPSHVIAAVRDGAQLIINLTNDAWFVSTAEKRMHLASSALRSVETRRAQIRSTNTGITALILPDGSLVSPGPIDQVAALSYDVPVLDVTSPAIALGAWGGPGLAVAALGMLVGLAWRRRARRSSSIAADASTA